MALIHTIGSVTPRDPHPWITKYIFPGGYTSLSEITKPIEKSGLMMSDLKFGECIILIH